MSRSVFLSPATVASVLVATVAAFAACAEPARPTVVVPARTVPSVKPLEIEPAATKDGGTKAEGPRVIGSFVGPCVLTKGRVFCPEKPSPRKPLVASPSLGFDRVVDVTFGRDFACALDTSGQVSCSGGNTFGQLGAGLAAERHEPVVRVPHLDHVKALRAGPFTVCAIMENGKLSCWGKNEAGESGSDTQYLQAARDLVEPHLVPGLEGVDEVASAWDTTCAVTRAHETYCFGRAKTSEHERLAGPANEVPHKIPELAGVSSIVANESAFCGVKEGRAICWGDITMLSRDADVGTRKVTFKVAGARRVSLGANHGCILDESGAVHCFGNASDGKLGQVAARNDYEPHKPTRIEGLPHIADVSCAGASTCATSDAGEVYCWGRFGYGGGDDDVAATPAKMRIFGD